MSLTPNRALYGSRKHINRKEAAVLPCHMLGCSASVSDNPWTRVSERVYNDLEHHFSRTRSTCRSEAQQPSSIKPIVKNTSRTIQIARPVPVPRILTPVFLSNRFSSIFVPFENVVRACGAISKAKLIFTNLVEVGWIVGWMLVQIFS